MPTPLQNRVTPFGEIIADPARGTLMGNRGGALHLPDRTIGTRRWASRRWICCVLAFKGRRRSVMSPGRYTELFFLDEATALAAGHRPCFECRRSDAEQFAASWSEARGLATTARADQIDAILHAERIDRRSAQRRHPAEMADLPPGSMILDPRSGNALLVLKDHLRPWRCEGYGPILPRPADGLFEALTPPSIIAALKSGYRPLLHETARDPR